MITTELDPALEALQRGELVAFPTETVYGLGADATRSAAVRRVFAAKGRPVDHPLIVHVGSGATAGVRRSTTEWLDVLEPWTVDPDPRAVGLAEAFWPGPLTLVMARSRLVSDAAVGGRSTIGLRVPDHPMTLELLRRFGGGLVGPSANRFGHVSPTTADHVVDDLGDEVTIVLDGGPCRVGVESTIVEVLDGPVTLLRPGGVSHAQLVDVLNEEVVDGRSGPSRAAGMLASHYAPNASVEVVTSAGEALVRGGSQRTSVVGPGGNFPLPTDAAGFAAGFYAALRRADAPGIAKIFVVPPTSGELLDAVLDRLRKAAGPRSVGSR
ncbi:MAG: L-threonylcarbamoyladenylate synthase [Actinomycetota bacterium]|nr:L-threonylcarbamoyladenylate synthase [Actinomycetota bacterium]